VRNFNWLPFTPPLVASSVLQLPPSWANSFPSLRPPLIWVPSLTSARVTRPACATRCMECMLSNECTPASFLACRMQVLAFLLYPGMHSFARPPTVGSFLAPGLCTWRPGLMHVTYPAAFGPLGSWFFSPSPLSVCNITFTFKCHSRAVTGIKEK
jgi:hypothetical protein